jgi:hypothetical protein
LSEGDSTNIQPEKTASAWGSFPAAAVWGVTKSWRKAAVSSRAGGLLFWQSRITPESRPVRNVSPAFTSWSLTTPVRRSSTAITAVGGAFADPPFADLAGACCAEVLAGAEACTGALAGADPTADPADWACTGITSTPAIARNSTRLAIGCAAFRAMVRAPRCPTRPTG